MSEMVERVARALSGWLHGSPSWESCFPMARAAIEAMREPTEAMVWAGRADHLTVDGEEWSKPIWQAMIDAALED